MKYLLCCLMVTSALAQEIEPLDLAAGKHYPARTWTSADGVRTVQASIYGADDVRMLVRLKRKGHKVNDYAWSRFSSEGIQYLKAYCEYARGQLRLDEYRRQRLAARLVMIRNRAIARIHARTSLDADVANANYQFATRLSYYYPFWTCY
jgi:hypothetical protein